MRFVVLAVIFCTVVSVAEGAPSRPAHSGRNVSSGDDSLYKFNSGMGAFYLPTSGAAFSVIGQFGYAAFPNRRIFIGPSVDYSLYPPGNMINVLASGWIEIPLTASERTHLDVGVATGLSIMTNVANQGNLAMAAFVETTLSQELDDLATFRLQARPGILAGYGCILATASIQFRFH